MVKQVDAGDLDDVMDPFKQPNRWMIALAGVALPVLIDRAGGRLTVSDDEYKAVAERYGGRVSIVGEHSEKGIWQLSLKAAKPKRPKPTS